MHAPSALLDLFDRIDTRTITRDYQDKQAIFSQGDRADALFYIRSGYVKLTVKSKGGKKAIVAILRAGDFFGEGCITKASSRMSSATAIEPCTIARVTRANITHRLQEPAFAKLLVAHLLLRLERIEDEFVDQIFSSSEKRLARILLLLARLPKEIATRASRTQGESGDTCGDGGYDAVKGQLLYEPIQRAWLYRLQRHHQSPPELVDLP